MAREQPRSITSSNAVFLLTIPGIYEEGVQLTGFASDFAFTTESIQPMEFVLGVDGLACAGGILVPIKQKIRVMPEGNAAEVFAYWHLFQSTTGNLYKAKGTITLPSLQKAYSLFFGVLTSTQLIPDVRKVLQAQEHEITWAEYTFSDIGA